MPHRRTGPSSKVDALAQDTKSQQSAPSSSVERQFGQKARGFSATPRLSACSCLVAPAALARSVLSS